MGKPTLQDIRYDRFLSNVSVAYQNEEYIAEKILPVVKVKYPNGKYFIYDKSKFRVTESLKGSGSKTNEVDYGISQSAEFVTKVHALKQLVPDDLVKQADKPLDPEMDATVNVTERLMIEKEYDLAVYMQSTSNITLNTTLSGTDQWSDYANSDPIGDIRTGKTTIHAKIFRDPNTLVLGKEVYDKLLDHPDLIDRIKYSSLGVTTADLMARIFGVSKVIIGGAGYETEEEGQSSTMGYIWGKYAWLLYVAPRPAIRQISFGYHFSDILRSVDKWYVKDEEGTFVRVKDSYVVKVVSTDCAYLIVNAIA